MSLHNGLDITAIASLGKYSTTFDSVSNAGAIANLFVSLGFLEAAPSFTPPSGPSWMKKMQDWFWEFF